MALFDASRKIQIEYAKARHPQISGIGERFHKSILHEYSEPASRTKPYSLLAELEIDLDACLAHYNNEKTHQGKMCRGRAPRQTLIAGKSFWEEKVGN